MAFFQACWSILKTDVMVVFRNFHVQVMFEKSLNAIFIALIPKKLDVVDTDFWPINLVGRYTKLLLKSSLIDWGWC